MNVEIRSQNFVFPLVENFVVLDFFIVSGKRIRPDMASARTPPSFDGIDRKMAYANKKYHSGWMCAGAINGLAVLKFSTSLRALGISEINRSSLSIIIIIGIVSFTRKRGENFILSRFNWVLEGLEDPFSCRKIKCLTAIAIITIGSIKCNEKNRFKVGPETDGPPQIHLTSSLPTIGIADRVPVITVAPQNDICPQGSTYPRNAVAMAIKRIKDPEVQVIFWFVVELKNSPRAVCRYSKRKNVEAPFAWIFCVIHPMLISCIILLCWGMQALFLGYTLLRG